MYTAVMQIFPGHGVTSISGFLPAPYVEPLSVADLLERHNVILYTYSLQGLCSLTLN